MAALALKMMHLQKYLWSKLTFVHTHHTYGFVDFVCIWLMTRRKISVVPLPSWWRHEIVAWTKRPLYPGDPRLMCKHEQIKVGTWWFWIGQVLDVGSQCWGAACFDLYLFYQHIIFQWMYTVYTTICSDIVFIHKCKIHRYMIGLHLSWVDPPTQQLPLSLERLTYQQLNLPYIRFGLGALEPDPSMKGSPVEGESKG